MGTHNDRLQPSGFVRMVNQFGNIYEGTLTPDGKLNGFCVSFIGSDMLIEVGWYWNNVMVGNRMQVDGSDLSVIGEGYYINGYKRSFHMIKDIKHKNFSIKDIFLFFDV